MTGCPVAVKIPNFIKHLKERNFQEAIDTIKETNNLPAVCGRVCPQEHQCESKCVLVRAGQPIAVGRLERFAADWEAKSGSGKAPGPDQRQKGRGDRRWSRGTHLRGRPGQDGLRSHHF
jgi:glutamate synthase (NADPH/NADH) small chain